MCLYSLCQLPQYLVFWLLSYNHTLWWNLIEFWNFCFQLHFLVHFHAECLLAIWDSLISYTTHPSKWWRASFVNIVLDITSVYRPFLGTTYQSLSASFQITFSHPCVVLILAFISLENCPCILFTFHSFFFCSSLVFLSSLGSALSSCVVVLLFMTATSNDSILILTYQPKPFLSLFTLFSHPISLSRPIFLETYNRATSLLGCNSLFIGINFLVFLSISCSSFIFYLSSPAPYLKMETV